MIFDFIALLKFVIRHSDDGVNVSNLYMINLYILIKYKEPKAQKDALLSSL